MRPVLTEAPSEVYSIHDILNILARWAGQTHQTSDMIFIK